MRARINYADLAEGRIPNILETFPLEWLTEMVKEWVKWNTPIDIIKVLRAMQNEESAWWLSILPVEIPRMGIKPHFALLESSIGNDKTKYGQFYGLICSSKFKGDARFSVDICLRINQINNDNKTLEILQNGVSANDPGCMYYLYELTGDRNLLLRAAKLGHFSSMNILKWNNKVSLMSGRMMYATEVKMTNALNRLLQNRYTKLDLQFIYQCGRELKGYEHIWMENRGDTVVSRCVQIFTTITCNAVRSIRTFLLCADRRNRDVWRMVARRCYFDIYNDVDLWWYHCT
jgi:hypothetical protein